MVLVITVLDPYSNRCEFNMSSSEIQLDLNSSRTGDFDKL